MMMIWSYLVWKYKPHGSKWSKNKWAEDDYNEVLLPQMNVPRREVDGSINPEEPVSTQTFINICAVILKNIIGNLLNCWKLSVKRQSAAKPIKWKVQRLSEKSTFKRMEAGGTLNGWWYSLLYMVTYSWI